MKMRSFILITALSVGLAACAGDGQDGEVERDIPKEVKQEKAQIPAYAEASFNDTIVESAFQYYLNIQQALVESDDKAVREAAVNLAENLTKEHQDCKELAQRLSKTENLEKRRKQFEKLTAALEPILRNSIESGAIYKQYCPMAFNNQGAYWLSETKEIQNPYFGDKMLKCGSTKETIQNN